MLKFFDYYTEDEKADKLIKEFVNGKILEHIECSTDLIPDDEGFLVPDDFTEMVADWFPKSGLIDEELTIPIKSEGIAEEADCKPADILLIWRNLANARDFIFEDTDFLFLDLITKEMIEDIADLI